MKIIDDHGAQLDATFSIQLADNEVWLFFESRGGGQFKPRNADYAEGFELLLARLGSAGATLASVEVYSRRTQSWPAEKRKIAAPDFPLPLDLKHLKDQQVFRRQLAQASAALGRPARKKSGGGPSKRIRLVLAWPSAAGRPSLELEQQLANGQPN